MNVSVDIQKGLHTAKAHHFTSIEEVIAIINSDIKDLFYIGEKADGGHNYRGNFSLKTKKEAEALSKHAQAKMSHKHTASEVFVYNERTEEVVPLKENDCLMYDAGYVAVKKDDYVSYDDIGNELGKFPFSKN